MNDRFDRMESTPLYWLNSAEELRASAKALWSVNSNRHSGPYQLLSGLALELLFKAIVVAKGTKPQLHHRLRTLSRAAKVEYTPGQAELLDLLTHAIYWYGRYPIPKDHKHLEDHNRLVDSHLWTSEPKGEGGLCVSRPNEVLSWDSYSELWNIGFEEYSKHHWPRANQPIQSDRSSAGR